MIRRTIGIIDSMTPAERHHPELIKASRKRRIAAGAGLPVQEVNKLLKQYDQMTEVMKRMKKGGLSKLLRMAGGRFPGMGEGSRASAAAVRSDPVRSKPRNEDSRDRPWSQ